MAKIKKFDESKNWETSKYWMGDMRANKLSGAQGRSSNIVEMAAFQRAISNFVRITTGKDIPVKFNNGSSSHTNGKVVTISATMDNKKFDVNVGLALHEGSHVLLTNFDVVKDIVDLKDQRILDFINASMNELAPNGKPYKEQRRMGHVNMQNAWVHRIKSILNIIEDRRIDNFVYNAAPGYRGYYLAMYAEYFNSEVIDIALKYNHFTKEAWKDYDFHMTNIMNPNRNPLALKKLKAVFDKIDLYHIGRLKTTSDTFDLTLEVADLIKEELLFNELWCDPLPQPEPKLEPEKKEAKSSKPESSDEDEETPEEKPESGDNESMADMQKELEKKMEEEKSKQEAGDDTTGDEDDSDDELEEETKESGKAKSKKANETEEDDSQEWEAGSDTSNPLGRVNEEMSAPQLSPDDMTESEKELIENELVDAIDQQAEFADGKPTYKSSVDSKVSAQLNAMEKGVDIMGVGPDGMKKKCVVIKALNENIINNIPGPFHASSYYSTERMRNERDIAVAKAGGYDKISDVVSYGNSYTNNCANIAAGIRMGSMLGRKLKLRNESSELLNTRLREGRIDKRLIAEIGYGAEAVFSKLSVKTINPVHIHYSIDASGSMNGARFSAALISAAAIAKAASMISDVHVVISFRSTIDVGNGDCACTVIGYDSHKNPISHLINYMAFINTNSTTPEGLCFESIQKIMANDVKGTDGIFINISDGEPYFHKYSGTVAFTHTRGEVNKIRAAGFKVLSYFVGGKVGAPVSYSFERMYGKDAKNIDVTNLAALAKTLNETLLAPTYN